MQRVENGGFFAFRRETRDKKETGRAPESKQTGFLSLLRNQNTEAAGAGKGPHQVPAPSVEDAERQLDEIHKLGERLLKERTFTALKRYKEAVQAFLNQIVKASLDLETHTSGTNVLNRKRFSMIQVIDQKLQRLAMGMLQTQEAQLDLLRRVEEINGMLVDLTQ
jgi:hypothetical protein